MNWPLLWHNLRPEGTSKSGHVVQLGDAAHSSAENPAAGATLALQPTAVSTREVHSEDGLRQLAGLERCHH